MDHLDLNSVNKLLSGCPILENLELSFYPEILAKLQVPSSLKRLKVKVQNEVGTCLEIDTPGLKYLSLTNVILGDVVGNLHNVEEAYLDVFSTPESKSVERLYILLRALSGIRRLELPDSTTKVTQVLIICIICGFALIFIKLIVNHLLFLYTSSVYLLPLFYIFRNFAICFI
jgi:hypothetical protein